MESKSMIKGGKIFFIFTIIVSILSIYFLFKGGDISNNINNWSWTSLITLFITNILNILGALRFKRKYPKSSKYRIYGSSILIVTAIFFDLIPRLIYQNNLF